MNELSGDNNKDYQQDHVVKFFADVFGISENDFVKMGAMPDRPPKKLGPGVARMPGVMRQKNQPEFATDAPWRLEPNQDSLPLVFYIPYADPESSANGPWRLDLLKLEQKNEEGTWDKVVTFLPENLQNLDKNGKFHSNFWSFETEIRLDDLQNVRPGKTIQLQVVFVGSFPPHEKSSSVERDLEIFNAEYPLPLSRASQETGPRKWFYGDTHYHSSSTNDIKEYGGTISAIYTPRRVVTPHLVTD